MYHHCPASLKILLKHYFIYLVKIYFCHFEIVLCACVCLDVDMYITVQVAVEVRDVRFPGTGVTVSCKAAWCGCSEPNCARAACAPNG